MKITIKKEFTTLDKLERTKEQIKEFKEAFTERDLLGLFMEATNTEIGVVDEVVYCRAEAFPGGAQETDETHYSFDMMLDCYKSIYKIHFYITQSAEVDTRTIWCCGKPLPMFNVEKFTVA